MAQNEVDEFFDGEMHSFLLKTLAEIEGEIRDNGHCQKEKARLLHQLGSIHGLMGDKAQQEASWQEAVKLDPDLKIYRQSLASLQTQKVST
jgi:hypothetical protein